MLPSERIVPRRQLELIDALAELGGADRPVSARDVGLRMRLSKKSAAGAAGFLVHAGLLRPGRGAWGLTEAGANLARLRAADAARARLHLRDHWQGSWFQQRAADRLAAGSVEEGELARHLQVALAGPPERGLFMVEWLVYALLVERDENGTLRLPADQTPPQEPQKPQGAQDVEEEEPGGPQGILDPLLNATAEHVTALPDDEFIALMGAYRTVFAALAPKAGSHARI
ncbi:hypothetical protein [Streptomyces sp. DSM 41269]|nr:hypothetical protein [Streptomyces sp. DSM 41269]MDP9950022.1 hypothetical protein [Streptomyces sp. DSM 41269]